MAYTIGVIDERTTRLYARSKLIYRGLIEGDYYIVVLYQRGAHCIITDNHSDVGCTSTLLWAVGRHPANVLILHEAGIGEDLPH